MNQIRNVLNKLNESQINEASRVDYDPFKKDMKIDDTNGKWTDGLGHRYSVKRDKSDKIKYYGLTWQYDYKKQELTAYDDKGKEVASSNLSIGSWLDNPEYNMDDVYDKWM